MLCILAQLYQRTGDIQIKHLTHQHIEAFASSVANLPLSALMFLKGWSEVKSINPTYAQYCGDGQIQARVINPSTLDDGLLEITVRIEMTEGWHIQSHQTKGTNGERTAITLLSEGDQKVMDIRYPPPIPWQLQNGMGVEIYQDICDIQLTLKCLTQAPARLELHIQACNESQCHQPRELQMTYWQNLYEGQTNA